MNTITVEELKARLDKGETVHLLDVREDNEREQFNIGGRHIPVGKLQMFETDNIEDWKDEEVVLYCKSGNRSGMATMILTQAGFKNAFNLTGGMNAWLEKYGDAL